MNTPKIRFKGFEDHWEQRKLNEIADVRDGTHDSPKYVQEGHPFITSKNVSNGFINYDEVQYITDVDYEEINKRSKVDVHDILMGMIGTIGNLALIRQKPDFAIKNVALIKYTGDVDYQYLYQTLQVDCVTRQLFTGMDGGTQKFVSLKKIRELGIPFTEEQEQQKIGQYFENLDNLITLHQRKCDETKQLKKFMLQNMFPKNGEKNPEIRFEGFTDDWEQRKFGEVFDCTVPNNTLSRAELSYDEGTVLNVHYGDVLIKYGSVLDVQKDDIPRIPHRCREDFNGALLQDGDVIIADTAEDETTGKACEIGNLQGSAIVSGLHTMVCRPRNRMALGYLGYYLNSNAYHHQLLPLMQGIKVLSLSRSNIQKTSVSYPSAMKEQQLIASYFSQLDHLITLHQRKCEKLKALKKFMLQNMFI